MPCDPVEKIWIILAIHLVMRKAKLLKALTVEGIFAIVIMTTDIIIIILASDKRNVNNQI